MSQADFYVQSNHFGCHFKAPRIGRIIAFENGGMGRMLLEA